MYSLLNIFMASVAIEKLLHELYETVNFNNYFIQNFVSLVLRINQL